MSAPVTSRQLLAELGNAIALALLRPDIEPGEAVQLDVRGSDC